MKNTIQEIAFPAGFTFTPMKEDELNFDLHMWEMDICEMFKTYFHKPYFYPFILKRDGEFAGVSELIINGKVAWLGSVIVVEKFRNKGLGTSMVKVIMQNAEELGCETQILYATDLGKPIYEKLGFRHEVNFLLFEHEEPIPEQKYSNVIPIEPQHREQILALDRDITGEDRKLLLEDYWEGAVQYVENGKPTGYILPALGIGFTAALTEKAAENMISYKISIKKPYFIFPESNTLCKDILEAKGYKFTKNNLRMIYGKGLAFQETYVFSRGFGYSG